MATLCIEGFGGFVASTAAPIATGWSDDVVKNLADSTAFCVQALNPPSEAEM
jgi:hypothetical protein